MGPRPARVSAMFFAGGGPSYPTVTSSRLWLDRNRNVFSDAAGTIPATITGAVGCWTAVGGAWGSDQFVQADGARQPTLQANGLQSDGVNDLLKTASGIALGSGQFTIYTVQSRVTSAQIMTGIARDSADNSGIVVYATDSYFTDTTGLGIGLADVATGLAIRRYRKTATELRLKAGAAAEVASGFGAYANTTIDCVLGRNAESNNTNSRTLQIVVVGKNITPGDADDLAIIAKLLALEPGAAWS